MIVKGTYKGKPQMIKDAYECALEYYQEFDNIRNKRRNSIALAAKLELIKGA